MSSLEKEEPEVQEVGNVRFIYRPLALEVPWIFALKEVDDFLAQMPKIFKESEEIYFYFHLHLSELQQVIPLSLEDFYATATVGRHIIGYYDPDTDERKILPWRDYPQGKVRCFPLPMHWAECTLAQIHKHFLQCWRQMSAVPAGGEQVLLRLRLSLGPEFGLPPQWQFFLLS